MFNQKKKSLGPSNVEICLKCWIFANNVLTPQSCQRKIWGEDPMILPGRKLVFTAARNMKAETDAARQFLEARKVGCKKLYFYTIWKAATDSLKANCHYRNQRARKCFATTYDNILEYHSACGIRVLARISVERLEGLGIHTWKGDDPIFQLLDFLRFWVAQHGPTTKQMFHRSRLGLLSWGGVSPSTFGIANPQKSDTLLIFALLEPWTSCRKNLQLEGQTMVYSCLLRIWSYNIYIYTHTYIYIFRIIYAV